MHFREGKKTLVETGKRGNAMGICATFNSKYICCRVQVMRSLQNCPFECTYCFLQNYLNDGVTRSVTDIDTLMEEVREKIGAEPRRLFRIGTWELGDSLALESRTGQAARLIGEFAGLENAVLELKTKSDCVAPIIGLNHGGRTVVSWSINTAAMIDREERGTASLKRRIEAMKMVSHAGYLIGLHFDPMLMHDGWRDGYSMLVEEIFLAVEASQIAWISIGSLRFNPEMKKKIENNYPDSDITSAELVTGDDGKMRYVKPLRLEMYTHLYSMLKQHIQKDNLVYLCMERKDVWDRVLGYHPESPAHLDFIFADSLYRRYGLGPQKPLREAYPG
jgi:spore photoproduct lyase